MSETKNILSYFPNDRTPRITQIDVLKEIQAAVESGYENIILCAPTGTGKSMIAASVAKYFGSSAILTSTTDLQDQYERDFSWMSTMKGKSNFQCNQLWDLKSYEKTVYKTTCDAGRCDATLTKKDGDLIYLDDVCKYKPAFEQSGKSDEETEKESKLMYTDEGACAYYSQKYAALHSRHTIFNYSVFFTTAKYSSPVMKEALARDVIILDEAHDIENHIIDFIGVMLTQKYADDVNLKLHNHKYDVNGWLAEMKTLQNVYAIERQKLKRTLQNANVTQREYSIFDKRFQIFSQRLQILDNKILQIEEDMNNFVVSGINDGNGIVESVTIQPIDISKYTNQFLEAYTHKLFMSATIDKTFFCQNYGLDEDTCYFVNVKKSPFPVNNRLVRLLDTAKLSASSMDSEMPHIVSAIDKLMTEHANEKGIILTTNYKQLEAICSGVSKNNAERLQRTGNGVNRTSMLEDHKASEKPTVLISPSLYVGVDLKDDLSRFQIIVKTPFPSLGDQRVKAKMNRNRLWYDTQTVTKLIQGTGRSIRHSEDYSQTYILDTNATLLIRRMWNNIPDWWKDSLVFSDKQPKTSPGINNSPKGLDTYV